MSAFAGKLTMLFPEPPKESRYGGMTVNERLFATALFDQWDIAIRARDRERAIEILMRVELTSTEAAETTDAVLTNPAFYGFAPG